MPLVGKTQRDPFPINPPQPLEEPIIKFLPPFAREKLDNRRPPLDKLAAIAPPTVNGVSCGNLFGLAAIPAIFRTAHLLDGRLARKRWQWRARAHLFCTFCYFLSCS